MNIMNIFSYRRFNIETTRSKEDILQIIEWNTKSKRLSNIYVISSDKPFRGRITEDGFKISQIIDIWSYVPVPYDILAIKGRITDEGGKTIITISMRPIILFVIFRIFFLVFTIFFILGTIYAPILFKLVEILVFGMAYFIQYYAFRNEADKAQEKLNQMLE